jgi:hypothetical protein
VLGRGARRGLDAARARGSEREGERTTEENRGRELAR